MDIFSTQFLQRFYCLRTLENIDVIQLETFQAVLDGIEDVLK